MTEEQIRRVLDRVAVVEAGTPEAERIADLARATSSLVKATVKTAELGQLVEELQDEKAGRLGARLRRGFGAAPGSTGRDGGK